MLAAAALGSSTSPEKFSDGGRPWALGSSKYRETLQFWFRWWSTFFFTFLHECLLRNVISILSLDVLGISWLNFLLVWSKEIVIPGLWSFSQRQFRA